MTDVPHFSYPFRFTTPQAAVTEQDSLDEIADCVLVTLLCPAGFRVELPEFGVPDLTFTQQPVDIDTLREAVDFWEPRALATFDTQPDQLDNLIARVQTLITIRTED